MEAAGIYWELRKEDIETNTERDTETKDVYL